MKKFLSLIIALVMLLSVCAMAEGKEISISNLYYTDTAGSILNFSGIELKLAAAHKDEKVGVSAAIAAGGEEVERAVLSMDEKGVYLSADGISDIYSLSMEMAQSIADEFTVDADTEQLTDIIMNAGTQFMTIMQDNMIEAGTYKHDGVEYQFYELDISGEQMMGIYEMIDDFLALYPHVLAEAGYESYTDMLTKEGIEFSIGGQVASSEDITNYDIYLYENGEAVFNAFVWVEDGYNEEWGLDSKVISVTLFDPSIEELAEAEICSVYGTIDTDPDTGKFVKLDVRIDAGGDDAESINVTLCIGYEAIDFDFVTIGKGDESAAFNVIWGESEEGFDAVLSYEDVVEDVYLKAIYSMAEDGNGSISVSAEAGEAGYTVGADISISDTDGAWLPEIGETVDIMSMDDEQLNKLYIEGVGIVSTLISACSAASEGFSALISAMM